MNVELRVEELVLHGFPPGDRHRIREALERELSRLFAEEGVPPSLARGGTIPRLDAGSFEMRPGRKAEAVGSRIARTLYGGIDGHPRRRNGGSR